MSAEPEKRKCSSDSSAGLAEDSSISTITSEDGEAMARPRISTNTPAGTVVSGSESRAASLPRGRKRPEDIEDADKAWRDREAHGRD